MMIGAPIPRAPALRAHSCAVCQPLLPSERERLGPDCPGGLGARLPAVAHARYLPYPSLNPAHIIRIDGHRSDPPNSLLLACATQVRGDLPLSPLSRGRGRRRNQLCAPPPPSPFASPPAPPAESGPRPRPRPRSRAAVLALLSRLCSPSLARPRPRRASRLCSPQRRPSRCPPLPSPSPPVPSQSSPPKAVLRRRCRLACAATPSALAAPLRPCLRYCRSCRGVRRRAHPVRSPPPQPLPPSLPAALVLPAARCAVMWPSPCGRVRAHAKRRVVGLRSPGMRR